LRQTTTYGRVADLPKSATKPPMAEKESPEDSVKRGEGGGNGERRHPSGGSPLSTTKTLKPLQLEVKKRCQEASQTTARGGQTPDAGRAPCHQQAKNIGSSKKKLVNQDLETHLGQGQFTVDEFPTGTLRNHLRELSEEKQRLWPESRD